MLVCIPGEFQGASAVLGTKIAVNTSSSMTGRRSAAALGLVPKGPLEVCDKADKANAGYAKGYVWRIAWLWR